MVRVEVIRKRIQKLEEYLSILREIQKHPLDVFLSTPEYYGSAERFLQLSIEASIDIGNHLVADLNLGQAEWHSDIPDIFRQKGYISAELCEKWVRMIGFRNVLVHDYIDVDHKIVYEALQNRLEDIEALKEVFAKFL